MITNLEKATVIYIYDNNGILVTQKDLEDIKHEVYLEYGDSTQYNKPVVYKGNWFIECNGGVYQIDPYTFETEQKTIFESSGGYEMIPGNFVRNIGYCAPNSLSVYSSYPRYIYIYEKQKTIEYSCDGI